MVGMFVCLCLASQNPFSGSFFILPEQIYQLLKLLTEFQNLMNENSQETVNEICIENIEMRKEHDTALVTRLCGRSEIYSIGSVNFINTNLCGESISWCPYHHRWSKVTICHNSQLDW